MTFAPRYLVCFRLRDGHPAFRTAFHVDDAIDTAHDVARVGINAAVVDVDHHRVIHRANAHQGEAAA